MLIIVLAAFIACWGPAVLYDLISLARYAANKSGETARNFHVSVGLNSVAVSNSFLNPVIYTVMSR